LVNKGLVSPAAISQEKAFHAGKLFFETEGILPAPESSHAIAQVLVEVEIAMHHGRTPTIVFCLSGHGYLDLEGYARALDLDSAPCRSDLEPVATDRLR
jgi:tryptophan synthase beta chain